MKSVRGFNILLEYPPDVLCSKPEIQVSGFKIEMFSVSEKKLQRVNVNMLQR
jgi:hypothetical protein